jgi:hypothetical protein
VTAPTWHDRVGERFLTVLEIARGLPPEGWRVQVVRPIAGAANLLALSTPPSPDLVIRAARSATAEALDLVARELIERDLVDALGDALGLALDYEEAGAHRATQERAETSVGPLVAMHDRPRLRVVEREPCEPEAVKAPSPSEAKDGGARDADEDGEAGVDPDEELRRPLDAAPPVRRAFDPEAARVPAVRLATKGGEPIPVTEFYARVADSALDTMAMLARHRWERRVRERAEEEARILELCDVFAASAHANVSSALAWWQDRLESPDPWSTWALAFALGCLDGKDVLRVLRHALEMLPPHASAHAATAAAAIALAPHPNLRELARELARAPHPVARAVGVDVLARLALLTPEEVADHLADANQPVTLAALRAARRLEPCPPNVLRGVTSWLLFPNAAVAWEAVRTLAWLGRSLPYDEVRKKGRLAATLGPRAIDVYVLFGRAADVGGIEEIVAREDVGATHIAAIARFGHPRTWGFFAHYLADNDLADAAASGLELVFGPRVPKRDRRNTAAWRDAIAEGGFAADARYRLGQPWRPGLVAVEHDRGMLSSAELELRFDELAARAGVRAETDLHAWLPDAAGALRAHFEKARAADGTFVHGTWDCALTR